MRNGILPVSQGILVTLSINVIVAILSFVERVLEIECLYSIELCLFDPCSVHNHGGNRCQIVVSYVYDAYIHNHTQRTVCELLLVERRDWRRCR